MIMKKLPALFFAVTMTGIMLVICGCNSQMKSDAQILAQAQHKAELLAAQVKPLQDALIKMVEESSDLVKNSGKMDVSQMQAKLADIQKRQTEIQKQMEPLAEQAQKLNEQNDKLKQEIEKKYTKDEDLEKLKNLFEVELKKLK